MSLHTRLNSLRQRHESLETRIAAEDQRPRPDFQALDQLKRQKLRLKDEIERVRLSIPPT